MIISIRANNFLVFSNEVELSMEADPRIKKKSVSNVFQGNGCSILKSACLFGQNGAGKSCFIQAVGCIRDVILGAKAASCIAPSWYSKSPVCSLGVEFLYEGRAYGYEFRYDASEDPGQRGFIYERFQELGRDTHGHGKAREIFLRDTQESLYRINGDNSLGDALRTVPHDTILIHAPGICSSAALKAAADILTGFAGTVDVICMKDIPLGKTVKVFKYNEPIKEKVLHLIKMSDVFADDLKYAVPDAENRDDCLNLYLYYGGVPCQAVTAASDGTKKLIAIASYIIDALEGGRVLVVDELDSSLHIAVTRAFAALFNSGINYNGQLIFATHEVTLMDCRRLFRKDQIWFANRKKDSVSLYSLAGIKSLDDGVRSECELIESYEKGCFGAVPRVEYMGLADDITGGEDSSGDS